MISLVFIFLVLLIFYVGVVHGPVALASVDIRLDGL